MIMAKAQASVPDPAPVPRGIPGWAQLRVWHLTLLVLFAAIAIADIQSQRIAEPALLALAAAGLVLYALIGWIGWWAARRLEARIGLMMVVILYTAAMGLLFLAATVIYLIIAHLYRAGRL